MNNAPTHRSEDKGSILPIAMVIVIVFASVAVAVASYSSAALRSSTVTKGRVKDLAVAEGAMRIALEDIRVPRAVGDGRTTNGSITVTSAAAGFRAQDVGKGIEATTIPAGATIASVVNATAVTISEPATGTASNLYLEYGNAICGSTATTILSTTISTVPVTVQCIRQPSIPGEFETPAMVITGADGLKIGEDTAYVSGDVFFTQPSTLNLGKKLVVEHGNVWYPATSCPAAKPSINRLTIESPDEYTYLCVQTTAANKYSDLLAVPVLQAVPATAPAPKTVGSCQVFYPGTYTTTNKPNWDNRKEVYLKSGVYYFNNVGEIKIKDTIITGGRPGASEVSDDGESLWNPNCKTIATQPTVNDTGTGVTIVLAGDSRLKLEDKGGMELYAPNSGYSVVAYANATNGYAATSLGSNDKLIEQKDDGASVRVHGNVWAPNNFVYLRKVPQAVYTDSNEEARGGQLLGGIVAQKLELDKRPPTDGYNVQVDYEALRYRVLVVATAGTATVRVVADVRPSGEELAVRTWHAGGGASLPTNPSAPVLVTRPSLATGSDTGTLGDNVTRSITPTFTGSAAPSSTVKLYADGTHVGTATAATSGVYTVTSSALTEGERIMIVTARNAAGDESESPVTSITVDLTAPTMVASDLVIAATSATLAGFVRQGTQYYVYANIADNLSGVATATANVSNITTGQTAVALASGEYMLGGISYQWRSAVLTANATLAAGAKAFTVTATDHAANSGPSPASSVLVDNSAPTGSVTKPTAGSLLEVIQEILVNSTDADSGVASVEIQQRVTGAPTWTTLVVDTQASYGTVWDTTDLSGAQYDIRAITTDNAGNSFTSPTVTVNGRPPNAPSAPVLDPSSDSGVLGDNITRDDTPTFTGTAPAGTTVKLYDGATQRGSTTAAADGTWTITTNAMSQASHSMTATATNAGGLVSPASPATVVLIDKTKPALSDTDIVGAADGNTTIPGWVRQGGGYYIYANATDPLSGVATMTADVSKFTAGVTAAPMSAGSWTIAGVTYGWRTDLLVVDNPRGAGFDDVRILATDTAGNSEGGRKNAVEVDNTAPTGALTAPANGAVVPVSVTVSSNSADNKSVRDATFQWSGSGLGSWNTIAVDTSSPYSVTWVTTGLTNGGTYDLRVVTTDSAGNVFTSPIRTVTVDNVPPATPSTPVLAPASDTGKLGDNRTRINIPVFTGTGEDGSTVRLYNGANPTPIGTGTVSGGAWSITSSVLAQGSHTITATATDVAGNVSPVSGSVVVVVDTAAPTITSAKLYNVGTAGTAESGDYMEIVWSEQLLASTLCSAWIDDTTVQTLTDVTVTLQNNGGADRIVLTSATCTWTLGVIDTRRDYVSSHPEFLDSTVTWDPATFTLRVTLGTWDGDGTLKTGIATARVEVTPTGAQTDLAGNAIGTAKFIDLVNTGF